MRAPPSGISLTEKDAAIIKGMLERGDRQHDVAAWFGVNGGRIAEIANGSRFPGVPPVQNGLPPPGPYTPAQTVDATKISLLSIQQRLAELADEVNRQIERLDGVKSGE